MGIKMLTKEDIAILKALVESKIEELSNFPPAERDADSLLNHQTELYNLGVILYKLE